MTGRLHDEASSDEKAGHIQARPVSWAVVVLVCAGFLVAGIALIASEPWLFFVGAGLIVVGVVLGSATHAMADVSSRADRSGAQTQPVDAEAATR
jgi:hypothetical protein